MKAWMIVGLMLLSACNPQAAAPTPASATQVTVPPTPTSTNPSQPPRTLTICLGQEPSSLYPVDNPSSAGRSVLAAVYDGPIDRNSYSFEPVILERLPSLENGDAQLFAKTVSIGDEVVDADGVPVTLSRGVRVRPAGCNSADCAIPYDDSSKIQMDQMQVTFHLLPGLTWSDGMPLTADDSLFSYQVAADRASPGSKFLVDRTQVYEVADETTVQWWGKPGFIDNTYFTNFWFPLPRHAWGSLTVDQLNKNEITTRTPLGWGPYVIQEWVTGNHITLIRNTRYFRRSEGLPRFDVLIFRFTPDPAAAISSMLAGSCDILDPSIPLDGQAQVLRSMAQSNQLQALFTRLPVMEQLALGIRPATYDNGIDPGDRVDFFGDVRVRRAVAMCLDREQVVEQVLSGLSAVPDSYLPPEHPLFNIHLHPEGFDVTAASVLLEQVGWKDLDNNPSTPRQAWGVSGIPNGTKFILNYATTNAVQRMQASAILSASLAQCGIQVNVQALELETLYAPGPEGVLFGRKFDLVEFAMGSTGIETPCDWYTRAEIPSPQNQWVGTNVSGYSSASFDAACLKTQQSLPDDSSHKGRTEAAALAQSIFAQDLPVIPLYWRVKVAAAGSEMCNVALDPTAPSSLWNIEEYGRGAECLP